MVEYMHNIGAVALVSFGAILGVIGANLLNSLSSTLQIVAGIVLFAIPVFVIHGDTKGDTFIRLILGTAGLTALLRGVLTWSGIQSQLPAVVAAVI